MVDLKATSSAVERATTAAEKAAAAAERAATSFAKPPATGLEKLEKKLQNDPEHFLKKCKSPTQVVFHLG